MIGKSYRNLHPSSESLILLAATPSNLLVRQVPRLTCKWVGETDYLLVSRGCTWGNHNLHHKCFHVDYFQAEIIYLGR